MGTKQASAPKAEYATKGEVQELSNNVAALVELMQQTMEAKPLAGDTPAQEKAIEAATPNAYNSNAEWEAMARETIGKAVDHTELQYLKGGGLLFTVVIKEEFSNAGTEYLERHGVDRRSKEIGAEGEAGVKVWCELINANLNRLKPRVSE